MLMRYRTLRRALIIFMGIVCVLFCVSTLGLWLAALLLTPRLVGIPLFPLMPVLVAAVITLVCGAAVSKRVVSPLTELTQATKAVADGDYSVRVSEEGVAHDSEMGTLIRSYNRMAEELESTAMFREDFISTFSHEFKTPIVSIRGFAKRLNNPDLPEEKRKEYLEFIVNESERLSEMSGNILLLTKYENLSSIQDEAEYDLDEQLRTCVLALEPAWEKRGISFEIDLPDMRYTGNEEMMAHVWRNLIGNAIRFSNDGGTVYVTGQVYRDGVSVTVRDEGIGMDEATVSHIFDKFYQAGGERAKSGCGLGLALVHRVVTLAGGDIQVKSEPGKGSEFIVTLPERKERE